MSTPPLPLPKDGEPRRRICIHGVEGCERCRLARELYDWSVRELTRFMCTDEATPATAIALDAFTELAP